MEVSLLRFNDGECEEEKTLLEIWSSARNIVRNIDDASAEESPGDLNIFRNDRAGQWVSEYLSYESKNETGAI